MMENLDWLQNWYSLQINGDWEHTYGIHINTIDNPGWKIVIDLEETDLEFHKIEPISFNNAKNDWCHIEITDKKFWAAGDSLKLNFLIGKFRAIIESR